MKMPKLPTLLALCLTVIAAFIILPKIFPNIGGNWVVWLLILACPLMHIFMMGGHKHGGQENGGGAGHSCCGGKDAKKENPTEPKLQ